MNTSRGGGGAGKRQTDVPSLFLQTRSLWMRQGSAVPSRDPTETSWAPAWAARSTARRTLAELAGCEPSPPSPLPATPRRGQGRQLRAPAAATPGALGNPGGLEEPALQEVLSFLACVAPGMLMACEPSEKQETLTYWATLGTLGFFQVQRAI